MFSTNYSATELIYVVCNNINKHWRKKLELVEIILSKKYYMKKVIFQCTKRTEQIFRIFTYFINK